METITTTPQHMIVEKILNRFEPFRLPPTPIDQYDHGGRDLLASRIATFVEKNLPIEYTMLGFPHKSTNRRDKVLGDIPDMSELLAMEQFSRFNTSIKEVYSPGIKIFMASDGFAFNNILGVSEYEVDKYQDISEQMANDVGVPVQFANLRTFYPGLTIGEARDKMNSQFGITDLKLQEMIMTDPNTNTLYKGMLIFMGWELNMKNFESGNQKQKAAKALTKLMMLQNEAYSRLVGQEYSDKIRLSVHHTKNHGKWSYEMLPASYQTPWHTCIVVSEKDGSFKTMHRMDAEALGLKIQYRNNQPFNFIN